jgi:hypothetical protein
MEFFTSPEDLRGWVKIQESPSDAAEKIVNIIGFDDQQDIAETCRVIFEEPSEVNSTNASQILFDVLAKHNLTQGQVRESSMNDDKMTKEAQMMRQDSVYSAMPTKICPKLPMSVGKKLISTYNCRHYCLDGIVFGDDPSEVYCAEALWRRHVMDKFSRDWKNEEGKLVGGYINNRFQVFQDDGGNQMELANGERTRKPRPHQYSIERRLEEGRGEETKSIEANECGKIVKLASNQSKAPTDKETFIQGVFTDVLDMREAGLDEQTIITKISDHYDIPIPEVAIIAKVADNQMNRYANTTYAFDVNKPLVKTAQAPMAPAIPDRSTLRSKADLPIVLENGQQTVLSVGTEVVLENANGNNIFQAVDGVNASQRFTVDSGIDLAQVFEATDNGSDDLMQDSADGLGLNDEVAGLQAQQEPTVQPEQTEQAVNDIPVADVTQGDTGDLMGSGEI